MTKEIEGRWYGPKSKSGSSDYIAIDVDGWLQHRDGHWFKPKPGSAMAQKYDPAKYFGSGNAVESRWYPQKDYR